MKSLVAAVERLTELFSSLQADAVEEVLRQVGLQYKPVGSTAMTRVS